MVMFYQRKSLIDLIKDVLPEDLGKNELEVLDYFLRNISVGEIIALKEIRLLYKIDDPAPILEKLLKKGLIERGEGCFNLSKNLRDLLKTRMKS
jgi:DNA-binding MarR family transcriptional regulator